jgi:hypothetical protein
MDFRQAVYEDIWQSKITKPYKKINNLNDIKSFVVLEKGKKYSDKKNLSSTLHYPKDNPIDSDNELNLQETFINIRDDSIKLNFYKDIQLLCENVLEETLLYDIPLLQKCRTHNKSFFSEISFIFAENYKIITHSLQDDDTYSTDDEHSVC